MQDIAHKTQPETRGRGNVLVVDDAPFVRAVVVDGLRKAGYRVDKARDARSALWKLEQEAFDVVITDLNMARAGNEPLLEGIAAMDRRPEVVVMTATRDTEPEAVAAALRHGAADVLTKPPTGPDELILSVQRGIERARMRDDNARVLLELDQLGRTDPLTGVGNRRALDESLRIEAARSRRWREPPFSQNGSSRRSVRTPSGYPRQRIRSRAARVSRPSRAPTPAASISPRVPT